MDGVNWRNNSKWEQEKKKKMTMTGGAPPEDRKSVPVELSLVPIKRVSPIVIASLTG